MGWPQDAIQNCFHNEKKAGGGTAAHCKGRGSSVSCVPSRIRTHALRATQHRKGRRGDAGGNTMCIGSNRIFIRLLSAQLVTLSSQNVRFVFDIEVLKGLSLLQHPPEKLKHHFALSFLKVRPSLRGNRHHCPGMESGGGRTSCADPKWALRSVISPCSLPPLPWQDPSGGAAPP